MEETIIKTDVVERNTQQHFDIAYIHAMQLIQKLQTAKYTRGDYSKVIEKIYYQAQDNLQTMQNAYDTETKNSVLTDQQEMWDKKIDAQLALLTKQSTAGL